MSQPNEHYGDLIIRLSHELGVALEMAYSPAELREFWPDALEALRDAQAHLDRFHLPAPGVIASVLENARREPDSPEFVPVV
jgi:hypothetical protein